MLLVPFFFFWKFMKLASFLTVKEDSRAQIEAPNVQEEHALLSLLKNAAKEIEDKIDYDYRYGEMDYVKDLHLTNKNGIFNSHGRALADHTEIIDYAENEKVELFVAGYDGNYEEAFIVPSSNEMIVKKSANPGKFVVSFRGKKFEFEKEDLEKVFDRFCKSKVLEYERIGERKAKSWDDDFDEDTPRSVYNAARRRWLNRDPFDDPDDDEGDYEFNTEQLYGAFVYKNLHHH